MAQLFWPRHLVQLPPGLDSVLGPNLVVSAPSPTNQTFSADNSQNASSAPVLVLQATRKSTRTKTILAKLKDYGCTTVWTPS